MLHSKSDGRCRKRFDSDHFYEQASLFLFFMMFLLVSGPGSESNLESPGN